MRLLAHSPQLWPYLIFPVLLNLSLGLLLYVILLVQGWRGLEALMAHLPSWASHFTTVVRVLLALVLLWLTGFLTLRFGIVLGAPWYSRLSEILEQQHTGETPPPVPMSLASLWIEGSRAVLHELKKLALAVTVGLALLLVGLLPLIGPVLTAVGSLALAVIMACLDFFDPPLERRRLRFRDKLGIVRRSFPAGAGFGLICTALLAFPLFNLAIVPLCVTAGTLFICDQHLHELGLTAPVLTHAPPQAGPEDQDGKSAAPAVDLVL